MQKFTIDRAATHFVGGLVFAITLSSNVAFGFSLIDTIETVDLGTPRAPSRLAISPDGSKMYASVARGTATTHEVVLLTIDTGTRQVSDSTSLGLGGLVTGMEFTPDGTRAYVPVRGLLNTSHPQRTSPRVDVIDTATNSHLTSVFTSGDRFGPSGVAIKPNDGSHAFVTHLDHRFFSIDTTTNNIIADVPSVIGLSGITIVPSGNRAYAASRNSATVTVIDANSNSVVGSISRSNLGIASTTDAATTPDGARIYVTHSGSSVVSAIDVDPASATFHTEIAAIVTTGGDLLGLTVAPDSNTVLVASQLTDEIIVIDSDPSSPNYHSQIGSVELPSGSSPRDIVIENMSSGNAYVSLPGLNAIGVISQSIDPINAIADLIDSVLGLNLQQGISNSLDAKLDTAINALDDLNENNDGAAINSLFAFINAVEAQRGNHIDEPDACALIQAAEQILAALDSSPSGSTCP